MAEQEQEQEPVSRFMVVEHEVRIAAAPERVWRAIVEEISQWWRDGFYALPNAKGMRIEPRIGGAMYEHADDGSAVVWGTVIGLQPGRSIDFAGNLTTAFGGPAHVLLRFELTAQDAATLVKVTESRIGNVAGDAAPSTKKAWALLLDGGLKPFAERA